MQKSLTLDDLDTLCNANHAVVTKRLDKVMTSSYRLSIVTMSICSSLATILNAI